MTTHSDLLRGLALNYSNHMLRHMLSTTLMRHLRGEPADATCTALSRDIRTEAAETVTYMQHWGITKHTVTVSLDTWILLAQRALSLQERGYATTLKQDFTNTYRYLPLKGEPRC